MGINTKEEEWPIKKTQKPMSFVNAKALESVMNKVAS